MNNTDPTNNESSTIKQVELIIEEEEQRSTDDQYFSKLHCRICEKVLVQPKLIYCGHSFCRICLEKSIENLPTSKDETIKYSCPRCEEISEIVQIDKLIDDFLLIHQIEEYQFNNGTLQCRACSSNDRAVAHCSTCLDYLCLKCCQAHKSMKCFEQHQVRYFNFDNKQIEDSNENTIDSTLSYKIKEDNDDQQFIKFQQIRKDFQEIFQNLDAQRTNSISNVEQQLTSLQDQYEKTKGKIDSTYFELKKLVDDIYNEFISKLTFYQRQQELYFIEQLEKTQRKSESFDDFKSLCQRYLDKCSFKENILVKEYLFDKKFIEFDEFFQSSSSRLNSNRSILFENNSIEDCRHVLRENFGRLIDSTSNSCQSIDEQQERRSEMINGPDSTSSSTTSGVGSLPTGGRSSSSNGTILSSGQSPSIVQRDEFFLSQTNSIEPVVENLRALESIFVEQVSTDNVHPNVQRNLEEILQMNNNQQYSMLTRQISAPPLGKRSPSSSTNINHFIGSSLLTTYSSTNSGGSSNGNNSRSTTPFSSGQVHCPIDLNYSNVSQTNLTRRTGQSMQVRVKFGSLGPQKCQFNAPHGFCLGIDEEIIVADTNNHRIQIFDKLGEFKYQFGIPGKEEGQLWYPRKVAVIRLNGKFVVCDRGNERSRMQIFNRSGHFIKKISIRYIDIVAGLAITQQGNIVAVDSVSPTVFCISESGDLIKWFDCSDFMREPSDIAIFNNEYFVCDFKGHCVAVFDEDGNFLRRIGSESITNFPNGIDISDAGDVIIGDSHGNRFHIAVYSRQGDFLQEFDCPYVKVSRCCGLKITSDGFIVTLAKNNHHVLVLDTLYLS